MIKVNGLSCQCSQPCPNVTCSGAKVFDACHCCEVCTKGLGESCGGQFQYYGQCEKGLFCHQEEWSKSGTCLDPLPDCTNVTCDGSKPEPCPDDSQHIYHRKRQGFCCPQTIKCVCNKEECIEPECLATQTKTLVQRGNGVPGSCCDKYQCVDINSDRCANVKCELARKCPLDSKADFEDNTLGSCCPQQSKSGCVCDNDKCSKPVCPEGTVPQISYRRISARPGFCCSEYICSKDFVTKLGCLLGSKRFEDGEVYQNPDSCRHSVCTNGLIQWIPLNCSGPQDCTNPARLRCCPSCGQIKRPIYDFNDLSRLCRDWSGQSYEVGDYWKIENDTGCSSCVCTASGEINCRSGFCGEKTLPNQSTVICTMDKACYLTQRDCPNGFELDARNCTMCKCKEIVPPETCPSMKFCALKCTRGYEIDDKGCAKCLCVRRKKCRHAQACEKDCPYGYRYTKNCGKCKCIACHPLQCNLTCEYGYAQNSFGCSICKCAKNHFLPEKNDRSSKDCVEPETKKRRNEGEQWNRGCYNCTCGGGKIFCQLLLCQIPQCKNPIIRNNGCCPVCPETQAAPEPLESLDCSTEESGRHSNGETWKPDSCTTCLCFAGKVTCTLQQCQPLPCKLTILEPGDCCRKCADLTPVMLAKDLLDLANSDQRTEKICFDNNNEKREWGEQWRENFCTSCVCIAGVKRCYTDVCEKNLKCANPAVFPGECCPRCPQEPQRSCHEQSKIMIERVPSDVIGIATIQYSAYSDCDNCTCENGRAKCFPHVCPELINCRVKVIDKWACCPRCKEEFVVKNDMHIDLTKSSRRDSNPTTKDTTLPGSLTPSSFEYTSSSTVNSLLFDETLSSNKETSQILVAVCTGIIILVLLILSSLFWWKRNNQKYQTKENIDTYPGIKPQLVEPVSCL